MPRSNVSIGVRTFARLTTARRYLTVSAIVGLCFFLCRFSAVLTLACFGASATWAAFCLLGTIVALSRGEVGLAKDRAAALALLLFVVGIVIAAGRLHLVDKANVWASGECPTAASIGDSKQVSACSVRDLEGWAEIDAVVYDSSDQVSLPRGQQSQAWWAAVSRLRLPFDQLEFNTYPLGSHYDSVIFDESHANFIKSR